MVPHGERELSTGGATVWLRSWVCRHGEGGHRRSEAWRPSLCICVPAVNMNVEIISLARLLSWAAVTVKFFVDQFSRRRTRRHLRCETIYCGLMISILLISMRIWATVRARSPRMKVSSVRVRPLPTLSLLRRFSLNHSSKLSYMAPGRLSRVVALSGLLAARIAHGQSTTRNGTSSSSSTGVSSSSYLNLSTSSAPLSAPTVNSTTVSGGVTPVSPCLQCPRTFPAVTR